jgi:hypothetical protein
LGVLEGGGEGDVEKLSLGKADPPLARLPVLEDKQSSKTCNFSSSSNSTYSIVLSAKDSYEKNATCLYTTKQIIKNAFWKPGIIVSS